MKKRILLVLFIINTLFIFVYNIPLFQEITNVFFNNDAVSIGFIGGADGPTTVYITSEINWFLIISIILEIALGIYLIYNRSKKNSII